MSNDPPSSRAREPRRRAIALTACALLVALAANAAALDRVRLATADPPALAAALAAAGFDVLGASGTAVDVVVSDDDLEALRERGLAPVLVARGRPFREIMPAGAAAGVPADYPDPDGVLARMNAAAGAFPALCRVVDLTAALGTPATAEGRHLFAVKISDNVALDEDEPAVLVVSAHHAREVVTPVIALHAIDRLTTQYGVDPDVTAAVDGHEIWIAPVWNPDGYAYVFAADNLWRKNRRVFETGIGVDQNRNYPFGWATACAGSDDPSSLIYRGPAAGSEAETQTMIAFSEACRFAKVIDYHSSGREALWGYDCLEHPFDAWLETEAAALSDASGYMGDTRTPSADGEHYQWQLGVQAAHAFLLETATEFQPPFADAEAEAALVFPGLLSAVSRPIPVSGHVTDAVTGAPVAADVALGGVVFPNGESITSGGPYGRYHVFVPPGPRELTFTAPGYAPETRTVLVIGGLGAPLDVALTPRGGPGDANGDGTVDFADVLFVLTAWGPCPPPPCPGDLDGDGTVGFADLLEVLGSWP